MKLHSTILALAVVPIINTSAFSVAPPYGKIKAHSSLTVIETSAEEDCGCAAQPVTYSGKPSAIARTQNPRKVVESSSVLSLTGESVSMNDRLQKSRTSLVVFLRSLGWPFCQEQILQYNQRRAELLAAGVELTIVSIGKPEVGAKLMTHLGISDGQEFFFVDPINKVYDDLDLNRGVDVTFFNPAIPMAFGNRLLQGKGIVSKELSEVLLKWKDAFFIPPKAEQAFNQGGAFLFQDNDTIYAHYDEATAAHAVPSEMIDRALGVASSETKSLANALTKPN